MKRGNAVDLFTSSTIDNICAKVIFISIRLYLILDRYEPIEAPKGQNIITTTRSHSNKTVVESVKACEPSEILGAGGCGHKVIYS